MNDNFVNITSLIHRQLDLMDRYHANVNDSMGRIDNCIQELLAIQRGRDRTTSRLSRPLSTDRLYGGYPAFYSSRNSAGSSAGNRATGRSATGRSATGRSSRSSTLERHNHSSLIGVQSPFRTTTEPSLMRNRRRNPLFYRQMTQGNLLSGRRRGGVNRRRMSLQDFINSTLNTGNPRIPAQENEIMQQTSMIGYEDLSGTNITTCPISLTTFDMSSNILRINECNHVFDSDSLIRWFREDSRCPLCRYNISSNRTQEQDNSGNTSDTVTRAVRTNLENAFSIDDDEEEDEEEDENEIENENENENENEENNRDELPSRSTIIYDISFSIPQLFGRDMSDNQIDSIIDNITNTITASMNQSLANFRTELNGDEEVVVEEMHFQVNGSEDDEEEEEGKEEEGSDEEEIYV